MAVIEAHVNDTMVEMLKCDCGQEPWIGFIDSPVNPLKVYFIECSYCCLVGHPSISKVAAIDYWNDSRLTPDQPTR